MYFIATEMKDRNDNYMGMKISDSLLTFTAISGRSDGYHGFHDDMLEAKHLGVS